MIILYVFIFFLGLCVGSFLNVIILRVPRGKKIKGRSFCPHCKKKLNWYELIPFFSFIFLRGKCSSCKKSISLQYPVIELLTAIIFVLVSWQIIQKSLELNIVVAIDVFFWFLFSSFLIIIFTTDLKFYIVPDKVIYPAILVALFYQSFKLLELNNWQIIWSLEGLKPFLSAVLSGVGASLFFLFLVLMTKGKGMGLGDVKIAIFMGVLLSFPNIIVALFLAFLGGSMIGLILVALKKKNLKSEVPFGCFLAPATFVAFFWGSQLINWYYNLFL